MPLNGRTPQDITNGIGAAQRERHWPGVLHVGVLLDAEEDLEETRELMKVAFEALGRPCPPTHAALELAGERRSGWFALPDGSSKGALESLLRRTADPAIAACVAGLFACTPNPGSTVARGDKAWLGAYLAACTGNPRVDIALPLDHGKACAFDVDHEELQPLRRFLQSLLGT